MRKLLLATTALLALAMPAKADTVLGGQNWTLTGTILDLSPTVPGGNQPQNIQCIICGDNQPQQSPTFGYTDFHNAGNLSDLLYFSSNILGGGNPGADTVGIGYDRAFLAAYLLANGDGTLNFSVGFDVNDNNTAQVLESFFFLNLTQHTILAAFSPGPGGTPVLSQNNGTGFPDYTLSGFSLDRGDIALGDQVIFFARISNASDGPDSFFLQPAAVPGPIVGAGAPGLVAAAMAFIAWRKRRRVA